MTNCDIQEWIVADQSDSSGTALATGNTIFDRLQQPTSTSDLKINGDQDSTTPTLTFKIYVKVGPNKVLNTNAITMTLNIKCSEETLNSFYNAKSSASTDVIYYHSPTTTNQLKAIKVPKLTTGSKSITFKLSSIIDRTTDFAYCGP